jgi:parvulin-like peptidyl-prolyl isomerase
MKKCIITAICLLLIGGCKKDKPRFSDAELEIMPQPQTTNLPEISGGFVLTAGSETISSKEIIDPLSEYFRKLAQDSDFSTFQIQARPQVEHYVISRISNTLLYQQAKSETDEKVDEQLGRAVDTEIRKFLGDFGGDFAKAEDALKKDGFTGWQDFREFQKKLILSQSYLANKMPQEKSITYSELMSYYNRVKQQLYMKPAIISFQLIDIQPAKMTPSDPNKTKLQAATELAYSLLGRLREGEDFGRLAKQYSTGPWADFNGVWKPVHPDSLAAPYDILGKQSEKIEPNQILGPITASEHIFIMKLLQKETETTEPFEKAQPEIKKRILAERRREAMDEVSRKIIQQAAIANIDQFVDFCVKKIYEKNKT